MFLGDLSWPSPFNIFTSNLSLGLNTCVLNLQMANLEDFGNVEDGHIFI